MTPDMTDLPKQLSIPYPTHFSHLRVSIATCRSSSVHPGGKGSRPSANMGATNGGGIVGKELNERGETRQKVCSPGRLHSHRSPLLTGGPNSAKRSFRALQTPWPCDHSTTKTTQSVRAGPPATPLFVPPTTMLHTLVYRQFGKGTWWTPSSPSSLHVHTSSPPDLLSST